MLQANTEQCVPVYNTSYRRLTSLISLTERIATARSSAVEVAGSSGADDDDAIAYAWFAEDGGASEARSVEGALVCRLHELQQAK